MGQEGGDEALRTIAQRLRKIAENRSFLARVGGDEFALLVQNLTSRNEAGELAECVLDAIGKPIKIGTDEYRLQLSTGVVLVDHSGATGDTYLRHAHANSALRSAKEERKSNYVFHEPSTDRERLERLRLERELRRGLKESQLQPHYQPIVDLEGGRIVKLEDLARWLHPVDGMIPPFRFISIAEDNGMIEELTETILRQACTDATSWPASITLSVNLSPVLMGSKTFPLRLIRILKETHLPPHRLELEITESALETSPNSVQPFIAKLRTLGVHTALDDFGTGYSSLSRLQAIKFDAIKIDRSFVQGIGDPESDAIIRSIRAPILIQPEWKRL